MKACENCSPAGPGEDRATFGDRFREQNFIAQVLGVVLIYLPILTLPFVLLSAGITYLHLKAVGVRNLKPLTAFLPSRESHRYTMKNQITMAPGYPISPTQSKLFWILNCTWYCPYSVGLFEWHAYLVKIVENWWCPFHHDRKDTHYREGAIDKSFWHLHPEETVKLEPEDRDNPIWNAAVAEKLAGPAE